MEMTAQIVKAEAGIVRADVAPSPPPQVQYPWTDMEITDSFEIGGAQSSIYNYTSAANKILFPKRFAVGKDKLGKVRVWRTA